MSNVTCERDFSNRVKVRNPPYSEYDPEFYFKDNGTLIVRKNLHFDKYEIWLRPRGGVNEHLE